MPRNKQTTLSYAKAGVNIDAGNALVEKIKPLVASTRRPEMLAGLGGFGGLFALGDRFRDPVLVSGTDGVGTKLLLARRLGIHDTIGIDLVAMCVNDILVQGAEPLFFLDYFACGKLEVETAAAVVAGIAEGCRQAGCALIGGETAEMPGMYGDGEYDLAGFAVGAVEREKLIDGGGVRAGDRLIGLPASGTHSNGYSLIRKVIEVSDADLESKFDGSTLGRALLRPTRIYVREVLQLLPHHPITGMAHITGGGLSDNIIRSVPANLGIEIDPTAWTAPPVFAWLQEHGNIADAEMRRTFNMGIGYVLIVPQEAAANVLAETDGAAVIGRVVDAQADQPRVRFL